jgi:hypothetical protein
MSKLVYKTIPESAYFGDIEVIKNISRLYTSMAGTNCDMLTMGKEVIGIV